MDAADITVEPTDDGKIAVTLTLDVTVAALVADMLNDAIMQAERRRP